MEEVAAAAAEGVEAAAEWGVGSCCWTEAEQSSGRARQLKRL